MRFLTFAFIINLTRSMPTDRRPKTVRERIKVAWVLSQFFRIGLTITAK